MLTEQNSSDVAAGVIISQDPLAGTLKTESNQILQIVVSKGPNLVEMPDILGYTQANASKKLDALEIQYKMTIVENDGTMAAGCVAETSVSVGTRFNAGKVVVIVSIAGERDDSLVASAANNEPESTDPVSESAESASE